MDSSKDELIENDDRSEDQYNFCEGSSNPNLTNKIDPADEAKMKGDAIGETVYSERFVLKTMLELMEDKWSKDLESDICTLWDMTTEKDVVNFLLAHNFIEFSISIIKKTEEIRLTEILVGIVGNMCCLPEARNGVYSSEYDIYISLVKISDTPLLVQLMRLFKALLFGDSKNCNLLINDLVLERVHFILCSSQNSELLIYTLQVVAEIIDKKKSDVLTQVDFLSSVNEAVKQLFKNDTYDTETSLFLSHEHEKIITAYLKILQNISLCIEEETDGAKYNKILLFLQNNVDETLLFIEYILSLCCDTDLFHSMPENIEFYVFCAAQFILLVKAPFCLKLLELLINIFDIILTEDIKFNKDVIPEIISVICYMINKGNLDVLHKLFKTWPKEKIVFLLKDNIMDKNRCDDNFIDKFNTLCNM